MRILLNFSYRFGWSKTLDEDHSARRENQFPGKNVVSLNLSTFTHMKRI